MKKYLTYSTILLLGAIIAFFAFTQDITKVGAVASLSNRSNNATSTVSLATTTIPCGNCMPQISNFGLGATSTQALFLRPGTGTTTLEFASSNEGDTALIQATASGTRSVIAYVFQGSNDRLDWYTFPHTFNNFSGVNGTSTISGEFATSSTATAISLNSRFASTTGYAIPLPNIQTVYKRVVVFIPILSGTASENATVYLERTSATVSR